MVKPPVIFVDRLSNLTRRRHAAWLMRHSQFTSCDTFQPCALCFNLRSQHVQKFGEPVGMGRSTGEGYLPVVLTLIDKNLLV